MNDTDIFDQIRVAVSDAQMRTPIETIIARGDARRHRRRVAAAAIAATVALGAGALGAEQNRRPSSPAGSTTAQLAAFTVASAQNGATALTLRKGSQYRLDPDALRQALSDHGIAALIKLGETCDSNPQPPGLDQVVSGQRDAAGAVYLTINPAAMPTGAELSIGYYPTHTTFSLIDANAPLLCSARP